MTNHGFQLQYQYTCIILRLEKIYSHTVKNSTKKDKENKTKQRKLCTANNYAYIDAM